MNTQPPAAGCGRGRRRAVALALLAALGLCALFAVLLVLTARYFYGRELAVRLQPTNWNPVRHTGGPGGLGVLFLGDSRAEQWPALPADRYHTLNAGAGGETTAQVLLRTHPLVKEEHPAVVVIQAGINDLKAIGVLPRSAPAIQANCLSNLVALVRECQAAGATVVITLIFPPGPVDWQRRLFWNERINDAVRKTNAEITHQFAGEPAVVILNTVGRLTPTDDYQDTLHLRPEAYAKLQSALVPLLDKLLERNRIAPLNSNSPAGR